MIVIKNLNTDKMNCEFDVRVDRETIFGNPFFLEDEPQREDVCERYDGYFWKRVESDPEFRAALEKIVDVYEKHERLNLFCWCAPERCHSQTIKTYVETEARKRKISTVSKDAAKGRAK